MSSHDYEDYPAGIRAYDNDPRSPFYHDPYEILEGLTYAELEALALETDDRAIDTTLDARPDPYYAELYTATDLGEQAPHFEVWDDQFNPARVKSTNRSNVLPARATHLRHAGLTPSPLIACHPYWTQAVAPTWTPTRSARITQRILREYQDFLSNI